MLKLVSGKLLTHQKLYLNKQELEKENLLAPIYQNKANNFLVTTYLGVSVTWLYLVGIFIWRFRGFACNSMEFTIN